MRMERAPKPATSCCTASKQQTPACLNIMGCVFCNFLPLYCCLDWGVPLHDVHNAEGASLAQ